MPASTSASTSVRFSVSVSVVEADGFTYRTTSETRNAQYAARRRAVCERWLRRAGFTAGAGDEWNNGRSGWRNYSHEDGRFIVLSWFRDFLW